LILRSVPMKYFLLNTSVLKDGEPYTHFSCRLM